MYQYQPQEAFFVRADAGRKKADRETERKRSTKQAANPLHGDAPGVDRSGKELKVDAEPRRPRTTSPRKVPASHERVEDARFVSA
ncbi:hypothetical protein C6341_g8526 [Phytophthora cactorum]|nr:hypothetical protein PC120_g6282 [Phytophthora cactorum]KAG3177348.1 hypothetical protein C6341_g8526 [Phytophthora cactorum]